jgi:chitinase
MRRSAVQTVLTAILVLAALAAACRPLSESGPGPQGISEDPQLDIPGIPMTPHDNDISPPRFPVMAYAMESIVPEIIPYQRLTHFLYSFLIPNADGTFKPISNPWKLEKIARESQANGVKVLIAVGGWGWDAEFEELAASPETRAVFVRELAAFVEKYDLDGADMDWEYPDPGQSSKNYLMLMQVLRQELPDKLLTTAVVALGPTGSGIPEEVFELVDYVNIMAYDGSGPEHSSMQYAIDALGYWLERGVPPEKAVLGVPFYARPDGTPYHRIVRADPQAAQVDSFELYGARLNYNGIPTIQAKTRLAMERGGGVMFWALEHDSLDEHSLLLAIHDTVQGDQP